MNREWRQVRGAEHRRGPFQIELVPSSPASNRINEIPLYDCFAIKGIFHAGHHCLSRELASRVKQIFKERFNRECFFLSLFIYFSSSRLWLRGKIEKNDFSGWKFSLERVNCSLMERMRNESSIFVSNIIFVTYVNSKR